MRRSRSIFIGFDPREAAAFAVARQSITRRLTQPIPTYGLVLDDLKERGLYRRPMHHRVNSDGHKQLWDEISDAPCSTEFSISRFLTPFLAKRGGLALFMDCDMLVRTNLVRMFEDIDRQEPKAAWCVKHKHYPSGSTKMDGQAQTSYPRKNWTSFIVFDCDHPANKALTVDLVNTETGRNLHSLFWLKDDEIGELPADFNWLVGEQPQPEDPKVVHFTLGIPSMAGYENVPFADDWRAELNYWAA